MTVLCPGPFSSLITEVFVLSLPLCAKEGPNWECHDGPAFPEAMVPWQGAESSKQMNTITPLTSSPNWPDSSLLLDSVTLEFSMNMANEHILKSSSVKGTCC